MFGTSSLVPVSFIHSRLLVLQIDQSSYPRYKNRAIARILHKFYYIVGYQSFAKMACEAWYATIFPYLAYRLGQTHKSEAPHKYLHSEDAFYRLYSKHGKITAGQRRKFVSALHDLPEQALYLLAYVGCTYSQCPHRMYLKKPVVMDNTGEVIFSRDDIEALTKLNETKICSR
jgi:hypothetical protein